MTSICDPLDDDLDALALFGRTPRRPINLTQLGRELARAMQLTSLNTDELAELGHSWLAQSSD
jgi:hypothetical protein